MSNHVKVQDMHGKSVEATQVQIVRITPGYTEIELEDGSIVEIHPFPMDALRVDEVRDREGNQMYAINNHVVLKVRPSSQSTHAQIEN